MSHRPARSTRRRTAVVSSVCLTAALLGVAPSAWATTAPSDAVVPAASETAFTVSAADASHAVDYWTPERRAAAIDVDSGRPMSELDASAAATPISRAEQVAPVPHIGRIFYTQGGSGYACSANAVVSANRSTIATAGHCLTYHQEFSTNTVFYPGYESGESSYGAWPVVGGAVPSRWATGNDRVDDSGFLAVSTDSAGEDLESVVGASPVLFDQSTTEEASVYGYPAAGRFDGEHLDRCRGMSGPFVETMISIACDMNEGVSGGPIFAGDDADGAQIADESNRFQDYTHVIGPIWRQEQHDTYDLVSTTTY
ncbi:serine protease [Clavibacter sp. VKM Ac-2872]|uniref:trypsin-like serine peptidase n=1 Tax=Clavibacter sp. VKM Ac-2872 TaxID=2783812 RepID=UPI00188B626E|nr:serine protease [Clavibacter sp. VKM Ac-2872]MBF4624575.1 serine protease [Clavibacter sp. VKM Ac-2872]